MPHIIPETNLRSQFWILFLNIWNSFLAQASVLLPLQNAETLSREEGPDLFLKSEPFQNFSKLFQ